jgi:hypothetical protein
LHRFEPIGSACLEAGFLFLQSFFLAHQLGLLRREGLAVNQLVQERIQKPLQAVNRFPVFLTRAVFDNYVVVPEGVTGQDEAGRLWDVVWMTRFGDRDSTVA